MPGSTVKGSFSQHYLQSLCMGGSIPLKVPTPDAEHRQHGERLSGRSCANRGAPPRPQDKHDLVPGDQLNAFLPALENKRFGSWICYRRWTRTGVFPLMACRSSECLAPGTSPAPRSTPVPLLAAAGVRASGAFETLAETARPESARMRECSCTLANAIVGPIVHSCRSRLSEQDLCHRPRRHGAKVLDAQFPGSCEDAFH